MTAFLEIIRMHFKVFIQYKWVYVLTLVIHPVILLINVALFSSIYAYNHAQLIKGYTLDQMVWYFTAVSFIAIFVWNYTDQRISNRILTGELTIDLLRPVSLFRFELGNAVALRICGVIFEFLPGIVVYSLLYFPKFLTVAAFVKFFILAVTAFIIYYLFSFLLGLSAFVIKSNTAIIDIRVAVMSIIGGSIIPLEFYPSWLNTILDFLPFKYIFYWPVQFFLNKDSVQGMGPMVRIFLIQWLWIGILYFLCQFLWKKAVKKFCAVGG